MYRIFLLGIGLIEIYKSEFNICIIDFKFFSLVGDEVFYFIGEVVEL